MLINTEFGLPAVDFLEEGKWPGRLKARYSLHFLACVQPPLSSKGRLYTGYTSGNHRSL